jgi:hypothetical protein
MAADPFTFHHLIGPAQKLLFGRPTNGQEKPGRPSSFNNNNNNNSQIDSSLVFLIVQDPFPMPLAGMGTTTQQFVFR